MTFKSIKKSEKLYVKIAEEINQSILNGTYKPGEKLPPEREIAEQLQVSRPSVREALAVLEILGVIEVKVGDGSYVRQNEIDLGFKLEDLKGVSSAELIEARQGIETLIVEVATRKATAEQIAVLQDTIDQMRRCLDDDFEEFFRQGTRFHQELAAATNNEILAKIAESLVQPDVHPLWENLNKKALVLSQEARLHQIEEHQEIVDAIRASDSERARKAVAHHLHHLEDLLLM